MAGWIISVVASVILLSVISFLLPEGKMKNFVKPFVFAVITIIIVSPLKDTENILNNFTSETSLINLDENFIEHINRLKIDLYSENCVKIAQKFGINGCSAKIEYNYDKDNSVDVTGVRINLKNAVITSQDEHIVILQRLKTAISEYVGIDENGVIVYE